MVRILHQSRADGQRISTHRRRRLFLCSMCFLCLVHGQDSNASDAQYISIRSAIFETIGWYPDGRIAFEASFVGVGKDLDREGIFLFVPEQREEPRTYVQLANPITAKMLSPGGNARRLCGFSDTSELIVAAVREDTDRSAIGKYNITSKKFEWLLAMPKTHYRFLGWGPHRRSFLALKEATGEPRVIVEYDLDNDRQTILFHADKTDGLEAVRFAALSPDRRLLVYAKSEVAMSSSVDPGAKMLIADLASSRLAGKVVQYFRRQIGGEDVDAPIVWADSGKYFFSACGSWTVCRYSRSGDVDRVYKDRRYSAFQFEDYYSLRDQVLMSHAYGGRDDAIGNAVLVVEFEKESEILRSN